MATLLATGRAEAFALKHTSHGQSLHWEEPRVTFVIDPSVEAAVPGGADAVARAVRGWSAMSGAPVLATQVGPGGGEAKYDGQNTILIAPQGFAPAGNALAVTVVTLDDSTGAILDTDVVINGIHAFAVLAAQAQGHGEPIATDGAGSGDGEAGAFDLEHVVSHETGHTLGLADEEGDREAVMYAYSRSGDASNRAPATDDLDGIETLYPGTGTVPRAGCGGASVAGVSPRQDWTWAVMLLAMGAGAAALRHRGRRPYMEKGTDGGEV
ncbi:MAG TPA: matrixin family metalloprotease [Polyangiaceae bacterium]